MNYVSSAFKLFYPSWITLLQFNLPTYFELRNFSMTWKYFWYYFTHFSLWHYTFRPSFSILKCWYMQIWINNSLIYFPFIKMRYIYKTWFNANLESTLKNIIICLQYLFNQFTYWNLHIKRKNRIELIQVVYRQYYTKIYLCNIYLIFILNNKRLFMNLIRIYISKMPKIGVNWFKIFLKCKQLSKWIY